jgi:quercetin dioxygenase-like cupin family protein
MTAAYVMPQGAAERRWMGETFTDFVATGESTGGAFCLVDEHARQGETVPLHRHDADVESFYVLDGEVSFYLGEGAEARRAGAGAFVHIPAGTVHGFRVESAAARYLILTTPRHGAFYRAISHAAGPDGRAPEGAEPADIAQACRDYGITFVGPLP